MRTFSKRLATAVFACILAFSSTAWAQSRAEQQRRDGMLKIVTGAGAAGLGALLIAASHGSASGEVFGERYSVSATNTGGMVMGVGLLGAGGYLFYLGLRDRREADSRPSIAVGVGRRTGLFVTKRW